MLVLTRKASEIITLGSPLSPEPTAEVTVIEVRGDQVRLGVAAPLDVVVDRKEIWLQKRGEQAKQKQAKEEQPENG